MLELLADAPGELGGCGLRERDDGDLVDGRVSRAEDVDDSGDERGRLAGACAGLDAEALAEVVADPLARRLVDRDDGHAISFISAKLARRSSRSSVSRSAHGERRRVLEVAEPADVARLGVEVAAHDPADDPVEHPVEASLCATRSAPARACEVKPPRRVTNSYDAAPCVTSMSTSFAAASR